MAISFHGQSPIIYQAWGLQLLLKRRHYVLNFLCDLTKPHVTSLTCIAKELCDFMGGFQAPYVTTLPSLVVVTLQKKKYLVFNYMLTSCDHVIGFWFITLPHLTRHPEEHVTPLPYHKSPTCQVLQAQIVQMSIYFDFNLSYNHTSSH